MEAWQRTNRIRKKGYFSWVVPAPRVKVSGKICYGGIEVNAKGIGCHDHNVVSADMRRILSQGTGGASSRAILPFFTLMWSRARSSEIMFQSQ